MQGIIQKLAGEFTDDSMPRYYPNDPRLTKGSLLLVSNANSTFPVTAFPAHAAGLKNVAWDIAKNMIPSGTEATLSPIVQNTLVTTGGTIRAIAELTAKKGFHVIISKVNDLQAGNDFAIKLPDLITEYILTNNANNFYASIWAKRTRIADATVSGDFYMMQNTGAFKFMMQVSGTAPDAVNNPNMYLGSLNSPFGLNTVANYFRAVGFKGFQGVIPNPISLVQSFFKIGSFGSYASFEFNKAPSLIFYEMYIEDLTVSGRTYAQAVAADKAAYDAAFAPGGKYYGDTHTDPAVLP